MIKNWGAAWVVIATMFFAGIAVWYEFSTHFPHCQNAANHCSNRSHNEHDSTDYMAVAFIVGKFLDDHNGAVGAVASVFIAAFTVVLALTTRGLFMATRGLETFARKQSEDMAKSIAIASLSAEAFAISAEASKRAVDSNRAWITWINIDIVNNVLWHTMGIAARWKNTGNGPAHNVICINAIQFIDPSDTIAPTFDIRKDTVITPDMRVTITQQSSRGMGEEVSGITVSMTQEECREFNSAAKVLVFYSKVAYVDAFYPDIERISETCVRARLTGGFIVNQDGGREAAWDINVFGQQNRNT